MHCMVVEESATTRRILRNVLRDLGCDEVLEFSDGHEALECCDETLDAVVVGRTLPGLDGIEFVRQLRARPGTTHAPVLMVAAHGTREDVMSAREAGVNGYVLKPFTPENLRPRLEALLRKPDGATGEPQTEAEAA